jgi:hypothetical protein
MIGGVRVGKPGAWLDKLSDDAKCVLGGHFGLMITPGKGSVTFQTPWNRSARGVAAFDELVAAGVLSVEDGAQGLWARTYRALVDCKPAYQWFGRNQDKGRWSVMVPDAERRERPPLGWKKALSARAASPAERPAMPRDEKS